MITKEELKTRLFHMASIFMVSALTSVCGFIVIPELNIPGMDTNTMTVIKFLTITAFMVHIFAMIAMGTLLFGDTINRIQDISEK